MAFTRVFVANLAFDHVDDSKLFALFAGCVDVNSAKVVETPMASRRVMVSLSCYTKKTSNVRSNSTAIRCAAVASEWSR
jgi:hypothetical protein